MTTFTRFIAPLCLFLLILSGCGGGESAEMEEAPATEPMAEAVDAYMGPNASLVAEFERSGDMLMASLEGVHGDQWTFRESDDRWNIAEIVEHIVIVENGIVHGFVPGLLEGEPVAVPDTVDFTAADQGVLMMIRDRSNPIQTNESGTPKGIYETPEEALAAFDSTRAKTMKFIKSTDADLRAYHGTINPDLIKAMSAYQWLLFAAGHVERHVGQIDQVKADPNYPAEM